jgi:hypothetical protein
MERFKKGDKLWWIDPIYITEILHTTKENYFENFINSDGIS